MLKDLKRFPTDQFPPPRRSISTSDLFSRPPGLEEPEQSSTSCLPSSSPHKLDPVQEEEKKGEEDKEEEEEEEGDKMEEKKEGKVTRTGTGETEKGNGWRGKEAEGEILTFCESAKPGEIEGAPGPFNATEVLVGAEGGESESSELLKKSRLCTEGPDVQVYTHR